MTLKDVGKSCGRYRMGPTRLPVRSIVKADVGTAGRRQSDLVANGVSQFASRSRARNGLGRNYR